MTRTCLPRSASSTCRLGSRTGSDAIGASYTLIVFEGQEHGFGGEYNQKAWGAAWEFFDRHLKL